MPTVLRIDGYRFFFFSNEGNEPVHVHIESGDGYCKFWINPVSIAYSTGYHSTELNKIRKLVEEHREHLEEAWNEYFSKK
ncbi:MAG: DUF4160 domain-containing protein [Gracilimonas sp.]|uniref:DUF4160 domain-containing protein n=1 Tax=Gracilimonas TaxID=649462 RepID=UPI001B208D2A|nr:DUF4160 domain-containing protein [Gracilimonas sp.]MBO6615845.1 DUF4160 domain-containing protein [Gracilimonas sp.]